MARTAATATDPVGQVVRKVTKRLLSIRLAERRAYRGRAPRRRGRDRRRERHRIVDVSATCRAGF